MPETEAQVTLEDLRNAPESSSAASATVPPQDQAKLWTDFQQISGEKARLEDENTKLRSLLNTKDILDSMIKPYASRAYWFMCAYSFFVGSVILLNGFNVSAFDLNDSVLVYLVGSTAATVIGLVGMVLTGIFVGARR